MARKSLIKKTASLANEKSDPREDLYINYLLAGEKPFDAAIMAGYSESTALTLEYKKLRSERFIAKMILASRGSWVKLLPQYQKISEKQINHAIKATEQIDAQLKNATPDKAIELLDKGVSIAKKLDGAQDRAAKISGLIKDTEKPQGVAQVSIKEVQNLLFQITEKPSETIDG